jgi:DNA integrity scanning protein DisA with diadenylate cyclase activity
MELELKDRLAWQRLSTYRDLDEFRGLKSLLAPEIERCFSPVVHEGLRQPFGALIARDDDIGDLGEALEIQDINQVRGAADGINTVAYCAKGQRPRLLRLRNRIDSQDDCSSLAAWVDGALVRVDRHGMIWVCSSEGVTTIDDRGGWTRPSTNKIVDVLRQLAPAADGRSLEALTKFAYSNLSPHRVGTTLLYSLTDVDGRAHQNDGESIEALQLNIRDRNDWATIEHQLRHTDGAAVIRRDGRVLRKGVILAASQEAARIRTKGGTRHNSACRHTFDRPDLLAFVVSADGPASVFSDGVYAASLVLPEGEMPSNPSGGEMWTDYEECPRCGSNVMVRKIILYGWRDSEEGQCPICDAEVGSINGWKVEVGLLKDAHSIERISAFRQRVVPSA